MTLTCGYSSSELFEGMVWLVGDYSTRVVDLVCSIDLVSKNNLCGLMLAGLIGLSSDFLFVS